MRNEALRARRATKLIGSLSERAQNEIQQALSVLDLLDHIGVFYTFTGSGAVAFLPWDLKRVGDELMASIQALRDAFAKIYEIRRQIG